MRKLDSRPKVTKDSLICALTDIWVFADLINFHGGSANFGKCHRELLDTRWLSKKRCRIFPRGHLKTTLTILEYLHLIYVNPNIRIFIGTGRKELAHAILREMKQYLIDPHTQDEVWNNRPHYPGERLIPVMERSAGMSARKQTFQNERLWDDDEDRDDYDYQSSDKKIVWSRDQIQVVRDLITKDPTIGVGSAGSASTGFHYDLIHIDDMIDFTNYDREDKKARIDLWKDDLFSLLDPVFFDEELHSRMRDLRPKNARVYQERAKFLSFTGDEVAVNGTRYFIWDWYEELKEKAKEPESEWLYFEKNVYKNGLDNSDGYLWSERWNSKIEKSKRESINDRHWYAQYLNQILISSEQCLAWDNVKFFPPNALIKEKGSNYWLIKFGDSTESMRIFPKLCIDPAASASKASDYTAIAIGGQTEDFRLVLFDVRYGKWTPEDWSKQAIELAEKWGIWSLYLESVVFSFALASYLKAASRESGTLVSVKEYKPPRDKSKKERIEAGLQPLLHNRMLYLPPYMSNDKALRDMFNLFPSDTVKDDPLDVIEMVREITLPVKSKAPKRSTRRLEVNTNYGGTR